MAGALLVLGISFAYTIETWWLAVEISPAHLVGFVVVFAPWVMALIPFLLFVLPPLGLAAGLAVPSWLALAQWGAWTTMLSLIFWLVLYTVHRIRPAYAIAFPLGALATTLILIRSALRREHAGSRDGGPPSPTASDDETST